VKTFLKAGFGGIPLMKRTAFLHFTNRNLPPPDESREFEQWRATRIPSFLAQDKLYLEFPKNEGNIFLRAIMGIAVRLNLLVNGGGQPRPFRSFGDSGNDKRARLFLTVPDDNTTGKEEILHQVQRAFNDLLLEPLFGWETCYNLPEGSLIILSTDLMYTYDRNFLRIVEQAVVVSKNRIILSLVPSYEEKDLVTHLTSYNASHPTNLIRKIVSREGQLKHNLQKMRLTGYAIRRPHGMPPPLPHDLDGEMTGVEAAMLERRLDHFLRGTEAYMQRKGFMLPPTSYVLPRVLYFRDREGRVNSRRFILTWAREEHSLLFYALWNNYHWEAQRGEETIILKFFCRKWVEIQDNRGVAHFLANRDRMDPELFHEFRRQILPDFNLQLRA